MKAALTASKVMQVFSRSRGTGGPPKMLLAWSNKLAMEIIRRVLKKYLGFWYPCTLGSKCIQDTKNSNLFLNTLLMFSKHEKKRNL